MSDPGKRKEPYQRSRLAGLLMLALCSNTLGTAA